MRPIELAAFFAAVPITAKDVFDNESLPQLTVVERRLGVSMAPDPPSIGHGNALYYVGLKDVGDFLRLSTSTGISEDWELLPDPATRASVEVPFGMRILAFDLAAVVAATIARLNETEVLDECGYWLERPGFRRPPDAFIAEYKTWRHRLIDKSLRSFADE